MAKDKEWQERIYEQYRCKVEQYIARKVFDRRDAEDLVQTVFLKCYQKQSEYNRQMASVSTWIYTITKNTVIDYFRQHKQYEDLPEDYLSMEEGGYEQILREETLTELAGALERLDQRMRDIIILHYYTGLSLKETADRMGMSYANVRLLHKKALAKMRKTLENYRIFTGRFENFEKEDTENDHQ